LLFTNGIDHRKWHDNLGTALYFSVITMTSNGYGDITRALAVIRTLTYMQAITSIFSLAAVGASPIGA